MPQLRKDPTTSRWVIVDNEHPMGAAEFPQEPRHKSSVDCPFCTGNEALTPPEIRVVSRKADSRSASNWLIRVVPNKFPAVRIEESSELEGDGLYDRLGGFGAHEVIIENPDHEKEIPDLPTDHLSLLLQTFRDRILDLRKDPRFKYIIIFKNFGVAAGASLEHPHSQLIALPVVPSRVEQEIRGAQTHQERTERCLWCDMLKQEADGGGRLVIAQDGGFTAIAPFASRFPFETWVLPNRHEAAFDASSDAELAALARLFKLTLGKLKKTLKNPPYNWMIHSLPLQASEAGSFHWHIEIIPHLTRVAGFELGTGFYVNPTSPELAADTLRKA